MLALILCLFAAAGGDNSTAAADAVFEREIRPILARHCFKCHGDETQESELRLDSAKAVLLGGSRGPAVEGGKLDSLLLQAIRRKGDLAMPPDEPLPATDVDRLTRWVADGADWPDYESAQRIEDKARLLELRAKHWAYQPLPAPDEAESSIDHLIDSALAVANLEASPHADRRTLIRRLSFDLTGLPPTPEKVDDFVSDDRPEAYSALVERLLASPQYGERWARHWLDVVRYTDSFDSRASDQTDPVEIWRYRDWVVDALNSDMPYDKFVQYQVAGDLIPTPAGTFNRDGMIATGVLAIGSWPQGDADKEKMVTDIVDDQIDVVTRTFLGVTMACARCHEHKFDPFSIEDYYGLAGVFFSSSILPGPGAKTEGSPILHLPLAPAELVAEREASEKRQAVLRSERDTLLKQARAGCTAEQMALTRHYLLATISNAVPEGTPEAPSLREDILRNWKRVLDRDVTPALLVATGDYMENTGLVSRSDKAPTPSAVANTTANEINYSTITQPPHSLTVHPGPEESVGIGWRAPADASIRIKGRLADADPNCGDGVLWSLTYREPGYEALFAEGAFPNGGNSVIDMDLQGPSLRADNCYSPYSQRAITVATQQGSS